MDVAISGRPPRPPRYHRGTNSDASTYSRLPLGTTGTTTTTLYRVPGTDKYQAHHQSYVQEVTTVESADPLTRNLKSGSRLTFLYDGGARITGCTFLFFELLLRAVPTLSQETWNQARG